MLGVLRVVVALAGVAALAGCEAADVAPPAPERPAIESVLPTVTVELPEPDGPDPTTDGIKVATFLGDETRRFYGIGPVPEELSVIWRTAIGSGTTGGTASSSGPVTWAGTGWTGQPALVRDGGRLYLIANLAPEKLARRYGLWALFHLAVFFAALGALPWVWQQL